MTQPVFLVAARRSGTTLFRLMLDGHPDVIWQRGWEHVADATAALGARPGQAQTVQMADFDPVTATSVAELRAGLEEEIAKRLTTTGKTFFGATVHVDFKNILDIWPDAKFVHLIRDPRDIAISFLKLGWAKHPFDSVDGWETAERDWDGMLPSLKPDQYIDLKYETLVAAPEAEMQRVCEFLDVPYSDQLFSYVETSNYSMPQPSLASRWKTQLGEPETRQMESGRHAIMQSRGYDPAYDDTTYSSGQKFWFAQKGAWSFRKRRISEEGIAYVLADRIGRQFNVGFLKRWAKKVAAERRIKRLAQLEKNY